MSKRASSMARPLTFFPAAIFVFAVLIIPVARSATFTVTNNCPFTVWPATLAGANSAPISQTGFELATGAQMSLDVPPKWSGRIWARSWCSADSSGRFSCATGDCGSGRVDCGGAGGVPPATLVEFTMQGDAGKDFYDVSNVDGFNLPVSVVPQGAAGSGCSSTACPADINAMCPGELQLKKSDGGVVGCKSACLAFNTDRHCCRGAYGSGPQACPPSDYSRLFKNACPQAYSYAYDDATSTFTCTGADYRITFCP